MFLRLIERHVVLAYFFIVDAIDHNAFGSDAISNIPLLHNIGYHIFLLSSDLRGREYRSLRLLCSRQIREVDSRYSNTEDSDQYQKNYFGFRDHSDSLQYTLSALGTTR